MIETITFKGRRYPKFQSEGFAAKFAFPFAQQVCKGVGFDVGCGKKEWALPGAILIDYAISWSDFKKSLPVEIEYIAPLPYDAHLLPFNNVDYIFSSHCLEHIPDWVGTLNYWREKLKTGGVLFLYLPHFDQEYWRPWNNRKHIHAFHPKIIEAYLNSGGWTNVFVSERDLNHSFMAMAEKI